jgi:hypothetical protein
MRGQQHQGCSPREWPLTSSRHPRGGRPARARHHDDQARATRTGLWPDLNSLLAWVGPGDSDGGDGVGACADDHLLVWAMCRVLAREHRPDGQGVCVSCGLSGLCRGRRLAQVGLRVLAEVWLVEAGVQAARRDTPALWMNRTCDGG